VLAGGLLLAPHSGEGANITMRLQSLCGLAPSDAEVEIWNPPGGYAAVNPDLSVILNVPPGTKVSATQKTFGWAPPVLLGPWPPAADNGLLPVMCR
jgi:hypothetical protein